MHHFLSAGKEGNFNTYSNLLNDPQGTCYDYESIMHYGTSFFSKDGNPTIYTCDTDKQSKIGQFGPMTATDILRVQLLYNCVVSTFS